MKHLIFNADDFGYSYGVNYGILESHLRGVLTSTTLMAGMPGFDHAVALAKAHPSLGVGVHLTLTCGRPLLPGHRTLTEPNGDFHPLAFYHSEAQPLDSGEVYREWKAQIDKVIAAGIQPTHLDSHHHVHTFRGLEAVFVRLAREYRLPVRNSRRDCADDQVQGVPCPNYLVDFIEGSACISTRRWPNTRRPSRKICTASCRMHLSGSTALRSCAIRLIWIRPSCCTRPSTCIACAKWTC